jgi:hypothetical protein
MTKEKNPELKNIERMLSDLIYLNGVIATELIKITENLAALMHGEDFLKQSSCIPEHKKLNEHVIEIIKRSSDYNIEVMNLEKHVLRHLEDEL